MKQAGQQHWRILLICAAAGVTHASQNNSYASGNFTAQTAASSAAPNILNHPRSQIVRPGHVAHKVLPPVQAVRPFVFPKPE